MQHPSNHGLVHPQRPATTPLTHTYRVLTVGMTIESDFYATDSGRAHFRDQLTVRLATNQTPHARC